MFSRNSIYPLPRDGALETKMQQLKYIGLVLKKNLWTVKFRKANTTALQGKSGLHFIISKMTKTLLKKCWKGSAVGVWDRDDYTKEAEKQLGDKDIYEEMCNDPGPLISTIHKAIEKVPKKGDVNADTIKYFMVKDPKSARFYLLPKIYKRLHDVPGWSVISNCGYYTENISSFLDCHLQPLTREVKSYLKGTNNFLKKLFSLLNLPDDITLSSVDVVGLYLNISHAESLCARRRRLDLRQEKYVTTSTLLELAAVFLKNNVFTFKGKTLKQKRVTTIGTKFAPLYSILFMTDLEEEPWNRTEAIPVVEVYRWHLFSLGLWRRESEEVYKIFEWETFDYKIHGRKVSNIDQLFGCYSSIY